MVKPVKDPVLDTSTDRDLDVVWEDVIKQYQVITNETILPVGENQSYDSLVAQVLLNVEASKSANKSHATKVLKNAGIVIKKFGGIASTAASVVFGPAGQCYNAISFVIDAGTKYAAVIDGYIALLEHCTAFLSRIVLKLEQMRDKGENVLDHHLRGPAYEGLGLFLTVQAHCRNLALSKGKRLKIFAGVFLFDSDDDLKSNLSKLTEVSRRLTDNTTDQILEDVKGLARYLHLNEEERKKHEAECLKHFEAIKDIKEGVDRLVKTSDTTATVVGQLKASKDDKENVKKIEKAILIGESDRKWEEQQKAIRKLPGTGKWLFAHEDFIKWAKPKEANDKLIILKGNEGYGKTYLCSHAIDYMTEYSGRATNEHVHVAYYFYEKGDSADACISALVYQLALRDRAYASRAASVCPQNGFLRSASKIWETLVVGLADAMQGHYFLVIDGYPGDNEGSVMKDLINDTILSGKISMHLFISGHPDNLKSLPSVGAIIPLGAPKLPRSLSIGIDGEDALPVSSSMKNYDDLLHYTNHRIDELCKSNADLRSILQDPKRDVAAKFARGTRGDFAGLARKLNEVGEAQSPSTIEELILRAGESRQESFSRVLDGLHETLKLEEIRELNLLLPWIFHGKDLSVALLRSVVEWQTGKDCWLDKHIRDKFKPFLEIDNRNMVSAAFTASEVREATPDFSGNKPIQAADAALRIGSKIQKCEVDLVQHFVRTYCNPELYARFQFEDFFRAKSSGSSESVQLDTENHIEAGILKICLQALLQKTADVAFKPLREYASSTFSCHLLAFDPYEIGKQELFDLGESLATVLWNEEAIDVWWSWESAWSVRWEWVNYDDSLKKLVKVLQHPHVAAAYSSETEQSQGVRAMMEGEGNESRMLARVAKRLADRWLQAVDLDTEILDCSFGILARNKFKGENFNLWTRPSIKEIDEFMRYAQDSATVTVSTLQLITRKAIALWRHEYSKEAMAVCLTAKTEPGAAEYWPLLLLQAKLHFAVKEYAESLDCIHIMMATNEITQDGDDEFTKAYWNSSLLQEGQCHRHLKQTDKAAQCFLNLLQHELLDDDSFTYNDAIVELFNTWAESENHRLIVDHVAHWKNEKEVETKRDMYFWFRKLAYEPRFHSYILLAITRTDTHEVIGALYEEVMKHLRQDTSLVDSKFYVAKLSYYRACILLYCSNNVPDQERGLEMLMRAIAVPQDEDDDWTFDGVESVTRVVPTLLDRGLALHQEYQELEAAAQDQRADVKKRLDDALEQISDIATRQSALMSYCRQTPGRDPRLALARLKFKMGDTKGFRRLIMDLLYKQFDKWPKAEENDALVERYTRIAHILGATDEDQDTIAAWQMINLPGIKRSDAGSPSAPASDNESIGDQSGVAVVKSPDIPVTVAITIERQPGTAIAETPATETNGASTAESAAGPTADRDSDESADLVFGHDPYYICDGDCGKLWEPMEDFYACKHCAEVQFCSPCHAKLVDGKFPPLMCNPKHEFVYVPAFDRPAWAALGPDKMFVGDEITTRAAWLEQLRSKWELRQDQIDERRSRIHALLQKTLKSRVKSATPEFRAKKILNRWKEYKREDYKDDAKHIALVEGVYQWVADSA